METSKAKDSSSEAAVRETISEYFLGMHHRDLTKLRRAFHPSARLFGHYDGAFAEVPLEEWLQKVQARPVPAELGVPFDMEILDVDITGQVAAVKVRDFYRGLHFTDYLHLARLNDEWRIVNKTFHHD